MTAQHPDDPAEIQARVEERLAAADLGAELNAEGITTISLDDDGHLVEHQPERTHRRISPDADAPRQRS